MIGALVLLVCGMLAVMAFISAMDCEFPQAGLFTFATIVLIIVRINLP
jgi:hypothetical protein